MAGCVTCKARRVKCDETKPTCEQCARRRITCGGYKIDVRWKQAPEPKTLSPPRRRRLNSLPRTQRSNATDSTTSSSRPILAGNGSKQPTTDIQRHQSTDGGPDDLMDLVFPGSDMCQPMSLPTPRSLAFLFPDFHEDMQPSLVSPEQVSQASNPSPHEIDSTAQINAISNASELWNMETFWEDYLRPFPMTPLANDQGAAVGPPKNREDEMEHIADLFDQQTCRTLSIEEENDQNQWKTLIWPLAKDYPALYHAIAALTCFGISKQQPHLRSDGTRHVQRSMHLLSENVESGYIPLDAALAATLTLGFADSWNDENSSSSTNHIRGGGLLLQQVRSNRDNVLLNDEETSRLDFLARTWTYMDVLARFTCSDLSESYGENFPLDSDMLYIQQQNPSGLDPLMGYSTTFFPIMRRVADLIKKVKAREVPRNSPAIISRAIELRRDIEKWTLPVDLETIEDPSQLMTDAIQTAEAYRWSTLMILYQAIPELPNLTSYGELAQKVLVYLATIPLSSTTIIVHIFPLIVAGCDAVEEEDRQFVRERWEAMSQRMVSGIVDRCLKVTEEVWKRREEYLRLRGLSFTANGRQINTTLNESTALSKDIASFINLDKSPGATLQNHERLVRKGNDFPISAAFKKGVDILTRSGCTEYTVRGRLHWLGVMKDWGWQVMLG